MTPSNIPANLSPKFVHVGLPSFIAGLIAKARGGGANSYTSVGYGLGRALENEVPEAAGFDEWSDEIKMLDANAITGDDEPLIRWLQATYPRIMSEVPDRRLPQFVTGFRSARTEA